MVSNFRVIPIRWVLGFFPFHSLTECVLVFFQNSCGSTKNNCQTGEFQSKFHSKNRYHTHCFVIHAISVFSIKFTMEFTSYAFEIFYRRKQRN